MTWSAFAAELEISLVDVGNQINIDDEQIDCTLVLDVHNRSDEQIRRLSLNLVARDGGGSPLQPLGDTYLQIRNLMPGSTMRDLDGPRFSGAYGFCDVNVLEVTNRGLLNCQTDRGKCVQDVILSSDLSDTQFRFSTEFGGDPSVFRPAGQRRTRAATVTDKPQDAKTHSPKEMFELGLQHARGEGVIQDYVRAHMWFNVAGSLGVTDANSERDRIATRMTLDELAAARKLARQCVNRNYRGC